MHASPTFLLDSCSTRLKCSLAWLLFCGVIQQCNYLCFYSSLYNFAMPQTLLCYKNELLIHRSYIAQSTQLPSDRSCYSLCCLFFQALLFFCEFLCQDILIRQKTFSVLFRHFLVYVDQFSFQASVRWKLMYSYFKKHQLVWMLNRPSIFW